MFNNYSYDTHLWLAKHILKNESLSLPKGKPNELP